MTAVVVHPITQKRLDILARDLPQSVLISGERGVGLYTIARMIAGSDFVGELRPQDAKEHTDNENGTIRVEMIRSLYDHTRAKHTTRQVVIIDDADRMSSGAQAAFLKLLEEPNSQIRFILTSHSPQKLLPTIRSRVQHTNIQSVTEAQTAEFIASLRVNDPTRKAQLCFIAEGLPAEVQRLIGDEEYFRSRAKIIGDARTFLQASRYDKMVIIQKYRSDRTEALRLIDSMMQILRRSISANPKQPLILQLEKLLETREKISANHNIALQLARFVV
jgi:replication-associated recombination protein RarA